MALSNAERQARHRSRQRSYAEAEALARQAHAEINRMRVSRGQPPLDSAALETRIAGAKRYQDFLREEDE